MMLNEGTLRRTSFRPGPAILLADGREWIFPMPAAPEELSAEPSVDRETEAIVRAIREAEDRTEQRRGELALAIHLLAKNYRLGPDQYQELLCFDPSSPTLASSQEAFHRLALDYLRALDPEPAETADRATVRSAGVLRPLIQAFDWLVGRRTLAHPADSCSGSSH